MVSGVSQGGEKATARSTSYHATVGRASGVSQGGEKATAMSASCLLLLLLSLRSLWQGKLDALVEISSSHSHEL